MGVIAMLYSKSLKGFFSTFQISWMIVVPICRLAFFHLHDILRRSSFSASLKASSPGAIHTLDISFHTVPAQAVSGLSIERL
jgi:hypothetical protein